MDTLAQALISLEQPGIMVRSLSCRARQAVSNRSKFFILWGG